MQLYHLEVDDDVISGLNIKSTKSYVAVMLKVLAFMLSEFSKTIIL